MDKGQVTSAFICAHWAHLRNIYFLSQGFWKIYYALEFMVIGHCCSAGLKHLDQSKLFWDSPPGTDRHSTWHRRTLLNCLRAPEAGAALTWRAICGPAESSQKRSLRALHLMLFIAKSFKTSILPPNHKTGSISRASSKSACVEMQFNVLRVLIVRIWTCCTHPKSQK